MGESMTGKAPGGFGRVNVETLVGLATAALGVAIVLLVPTQVDEPPRFFGRSSAGLSPRAFPTFAGAAFAVFGLLMAVASLRLRIANPFAALQGQAWANLAVALCAMIAYVALLRPIGYVASSALVAGLISFYYGARSPVGLGLVAIVAPVTIFVVFTRFLSVSLPPFPGF